MQMLPAEPNFSVLQGYVKAPLSVNNGVGALSLGVIVDHTFEI
jgi:hypothetical protein